MPTPWLPIHRGRKDQHRSSPAASTLLYIPEAQDRSSRGGPDRLLSVRSFPMPPLRPGPPPGPMPPRRPMPPPAWPGCAARRDGRKHVSTAAPTSCRTMNGIPPPPSASPPTAALSSPWPARRSLSRPTAPPAGTRRSSAAAAPGSAPSATRCRTSRSAAPVCSGGCASLSAWLAPS